MRRLVDKTCSFHFPFSISRSHYIRCNGGLSFLCSPSLFVYEDVLDFPHPKTPSPRFDGAIFPIWLSNNKTYFLGRRSRTKTAAVKFVGYLLKIHFPLFIFVSSFFPLSAEFPFVSFLFLPGKGEVGPSLLAFDATQAQVMFCGIFDEEGRRWVECVGHEWRVQKCQFYAWANT